jgi:hypothetical protein
MMNTCCSKHVEAWNKYIKKEWVKLVINQNYFKMHDQQNIKTQLNYFQIIYTKFHIIQSIDVTKWEWKYFYSLK